MTRLRLLLPQWQGGMNPHYVFGAELLALIAPPSETDDLVTIEVKKDFEAGLGREHGVDHYAELMQQVKATRAVLEEKDPEQLIVFGGDCSISQAPFAYLSEKYGDKLGILWLDAHPDIATNQQSSHLHEMVLGNLIGEGSPDFAAEVKCPIAPQRVMYAGLIESDLRDIDDGVYRHQISFAQPADLIENSQVILDWIDREGIQVLAVHFDLDVLSPQDFRSIYPVEPHTRLEDFPAAVGQLSLEQVVRILADLSQKTDLVGLSIAEHLPWDAIHLRKALSEISIFK